MDEWLRSESLPWQLRAAVVLAAGLIVGLSILAIPKHRLAQIGQKRGLSPNHITAYRGLCCFVGSLLFFLVTAWGCLLYAVGCILDVTDGKMAKAMAELGIKRSEADLAFGKMIDPLMDKLSILPNIGVFAFKGIVWWQLAVAVVAVDVFGTIFRNAWFMRKGEATWVGKVKTLLQCFVLIAGVPQCLDWIPSSFVPNALLVGAFTFGLGSIVSRMRFRHIEAAVDATDRHFHHKDL